VNKYPKVGDTYEAAYARGLCFVCETPKSNYRICIQVNKNRGDDIILRCHKKCVRSMAEEKIIKCIE